jgi:hypothetical protein
MRDSKKYPDDMVENLAESMGICSDGPASARIKIPKEGAFSLREGKKERKEGSSFGLGTRKEAANLTPRDLRPTGARQARTVREERGRSRPKVRTVR